MARMRVSIAGLMGLVVILAVGCVALSHPSDLWTTMILNATLVLLAIAVLLAIVRHGPARTFWAGFSAWGWIYLTLVFTPWTSSIRMDLWTSTMLDVIAKLQGHDVLKSSYQEIIGNPYFANFYLIGHAFWALILALLGGILACFLVPSGGNPATPVKSPL